MRHRIVRYFFPQIDNAFRSIDRTHIQRTRNIRLIPDFNHRKGGKTSYAEWAHVIGIFQTLICQSLSKLTGNNILDIGCGTGLMAIASEPFITEGGRYTGLDVVRANIDFCTKHFQEERYQFLHHNYVNSKYAKDQSAQLTPWPVENDSCDLVTALSVWTHLNEKDASFYMREVDRVLKRGGKAIITFFYLDVLYVNSLSHRSNIQGRFHLSNQNLWSFNKPAYQSAHWYTPEWTRVPEEAIGIDEIGFQTLLDQTSLNTVAYYPGNWKEIPGVFFQDIFILVK